MTVAPFRVGGVGRLPDGAVLTWSLAEGARGRRWRAGVAGADGLSAAVLLEVGLDGRPTKLELATRAGLLSVHPEADDSLHGNVVSATGVRPIRLRWSRDHALLVAGLPVTTAVLCNRLREATGVGEEAEVRAAEIDRELHVTQRVAAVRRLSPTGWLVDGRESEVDERGVPQLIDGAEWPLEEDAAP